MTTDVSEELNDRWPGRPDYVGPDEGIGGNVHHDEPWEYCWSFRGRVQVIRDSKPANEVATRLYWLVRLTPVEGPLWQALQLARQAYWQARQAYDQAWHTYDPAWHTYAKTGQTYAQAWRAYAQAGQAYAQAWHTYAAVHGAETQAEWAELTIEAGAPWDATRGEMIYPPAR